MSLQEKVVNGLVWSATKNWGEKILSFVIFLILSRLLGPEAFGLVALALVFVAFAEIILDQGFADAIVQRGELDAAHLDTAFWICILTGGALTLIGIAASGALATLFREPRLAPVIAWLSLSFLLGALSSTQKAILQRQLDFKHLATRSLGATLLSGIVCIAMALYGFGFWSLVAKQLVFGLVGTILLWRVSDWRPGLNFSTQHFKELSGFGVHVVGSRTLEFLTRRSDDFLIGYFLGSVALGYYTIAYRLLLVLINLLTGITTVVTFSTFSRMQDDPERVRRAYYKATRYTAVIAIPAFLGISAVAPELVPVMFGSQWSPSVPVMRILALVGVLLSLFYFNGSVIKAAGKPSWHLQIMLLIAVANVIGFMVVVRWGIVAVAAAYVAVSFLLAPVSWIAVDRLIKIDFRTYLGQCLMPVVASLVMLVTIACLRLLPTAKMSLYLQLGILVVSGAAAYLLVVVLWVRPRYQEVLYLVGLVWPRWRLKGA